MYLVRLAPDKHGGFFTVAVYFIVGEKIHTLGGKKCLSVGAANSSNEECFVFAMNVEELLL